MQIDQIYTTLGEAILKRLNAEDMSHQDIKAATDFLKALDYQVNPVPGSAVDEVKAALEDLPKFPRAASS